jgi:uncharacterized protein YbaR (Trm112 family)
MISPELVNILKCPIGKVPLKAEDENLICTKCGVIFPIKNGIPALLIDETVFPEGVKDISELNCMDGKNDS